jgi:ligand-binding SRPBCC domain-containing protein
MTRIQLTTEINAGIQICFDLSRAVEIHLESTKKTRERVVAGRAQGLFELNDEVTWEAIHLGIKQKLTVRISKMSAPHFFEDVMIKGVFKTMRHEHHFKELNGKTLMTDIFEYKVPLGVIGKIFDTLILRRYMTCFLKIRNQTIKEAAEK